VILSASCGTKRDGSLVSLAVGLGPSLWLLITEIYPTAIRGQAMSMASVTIWIFDFLASVTFLSLVTSPAPRQAFWLYTAASVGAICFSARRVPEAKSRTLEEIEASWGS
jgi:MFS transporter, SP family, arabinose:H+ symporter